MPMTKKCDLCNCEPNALFRCSYGKSRTWKFLCKLCLEKIKLSFEEYAQPILSPSQDLVPNPESAKYCYFANMHNIFPNDRGQNRSFFLGKKISKMILNDF